MDELLDSLNEEQIKPVLQTEGPVLVLAGAGSGKTRVLTTRIAYILREGKADLSEVLAITFTNKAAAEMKERLRWQLDTYVDEEDGKWICTIHSMCVKILRRFATEAGFEQNFSIYSEVERNNVIKKAFNELDFDDDALLKNAKYHIANAKTLGLNPEEYGRKFSRERGMDDIVCIYERYDKHLKANNALDFDDLLLETRNLLRRDGEVCDYLSDKFKYILVDEFQDTNAVQYEIIKLLSGRHGNIFAVGDDDQSIYGWRGAEIKNILAFDKDFPTAKVYKLERNYRSTKSILRLANGIIKNNLSRRGKVLWTEAAEGDRPVYFQADEEAGEALHCARAILDGVSAGRSFSDFAVLMRINALTRSYEQEFNKYGIPYKVFGGFRFFERREIKDVLAYLRLIANPFDSEAAERIINVPRRGIGAKTLALMNGYAEREGLPLYNAARDADEIGVPRGTAEKLKEFAALIKELMIASMDMPVNELVRLVLSRTDVRSAYDDGTDEGDSKLANVEEFIASVDDYSRLNKGATLNDYLNQITLASDTDDIQDGNFVTLATVHSAKGLEFPVVFICGLEEGIFPTSRSEQESGDCEEERRLMYVAITRAKEKLYLTRSKSRYLYGRRDVTRPSKFIGELAAELGVSAVERSPYGYAGRRFGGYRTDYGGERSTGRAVYSSYDDVESDSRPAAGSGFKPYRPAPVAPKPAAGGGNYVVGQRVSHPKFGVGMIIAIKNGGTVLNVAFDGQGIKELSASIAPLKKL